MRWIAFLVAAVAIAPKYQGSDSAPVQVAEVSAYCEGPVFDRAGNLYVSHGPYISKIAPDGETAVWAETGSPNGHKVKPDGTHLICEDDAVLHLSADGEILGKAASDCGGEPVRAGNDLTLSPEGGFYFTDPGVRPPALEEPIGRVCYVDAGGTSHLVADGLGYPNGIVLNPDGKSLLVGESMRGRNRILEFDVHAPGKVGSDRVFAQLPFSETGAFVSPDGMAFDEDGNLYVAHFGMGQVQVLDPNGKLIRSIPAGNGAASNVAFGGANRNQLYVTGAEALFEGE